MELFWFSSRFFWSYLGWLWNFGMLCNALEVWRIWSNKLQGFTETEISGLSWWIAHGELRRRICGSSVLAKHPQVWGWAICQLWPSLLGVSCIFLSYLVACGGAWRSCCFFLPCSSCSSSSFLVCATCGFCVVLSFLLTPGISAPFSLHAPSTSFSHNRWQR